MSGWMVLFFVFFVLMVVAGLSGFFVSPGMIAGLVETLALVFLFCALGCLSRIPGKRIKIDT